MREAEVVERARRDGAREAHRDAPAPGTARLRGWSGAGAPHRRRFPGPACGDAAICTSRTARLSVRRTPSSVPPAASRSLVPASTIVQFSSWNCNRRAARWRRDAGPAQLASHGAGAAGASPAGGCALEHRFVDPSRSCYPGGPCDRAPRHPPRPLPRPPRHRRRHLELPLPPRGEHPRLRPAHLRGRGGVYFTRLEFQTDKLDLPLEDLKHAFALDVARPFAMDWRLTLSSERKKVAVLVSRHDHALLELLWTWKRGDLRGGHRPRGLEPPRSARARWSPSACRSRTCRTAARSGRPPRPAWSSCSRGRPTCSCSRATCRSSRRSWWPAGPTGSSTSTTPSSPPSSARTRTGRPTSAA